MIVYQRSRDCKQIFKIFPNAIARSCAPDCGSRPAGRKLSAHGQSAVVTEAACASFRRCRHVHCRLRAKVVDAMRIFLSSLNVASGSHSLQKTHLLRERNGRLEIRCSIWPSYGRSRQEFPYNYTRWNDNRRFPYSLILKRKCLKINKVEARGVEPLFRKGA